MSLNREFLIWKERGRGEKGRGRGLERERWAGRSAGRIFKVRFGREREKEGKDRDIERGTSKETELTIKIPN
jgi:hypothetical protein